MSFLNSVREANARKFLALFGLIFIFIYAGNAAAIEIVGNQLEIYGTIHGSVDYMDSDVPDSVANANSEDKLLSGDVGISSNTSKLGVKGVHNLNDKIRLLYQAEQFVDLSNNNDKTFSTRNTYLGIGGDFGEVLMGRYDTPFKLVSSRYSVLSDTLGDRRAILGASSTRGNRLNLRAEKMILWRNKTALANGTFDWIIQYSAKANKNSGVTAGDDRTMWGAWGQWSRDSFSVVMAHDSWSSIYDGEIDATRIATKNTFGNIIAAVIFENIQHDLDAGGQGVLDRNAWGANLTYERDSWTYYTQMLSASSYANIPDSGALMFSVAAEKTLGKGLTTYVIYSQTDNDTNATYQGVDGGHGDELGTLPGGTPKAVSVGLKFAF